VPHDNPRNSVGDLTPGCLLRPTHRRAAGHDASGAEWDGYCTAAWTARAMPGRILGHGVDLDQEQPGIGQADRLYPFSARLHPWAKLRASGDRDGISRARYADPTISRCLKMRIRSSSFLLKGLVLLALIGLAGPPAFASPSNKWRIEVSEGAKSDGEIIFYMTPVGSEPIEIRVAIDKGTGENRVARKIHAAFQRALSGDLYNVEVDDGEDVLVKKRAKGAKFDLALVSSSVRSVRIKLDKE
jgi:hypothetical protein